MTNPTNSGKTALTAGAIESWRLSGIPVSCWRAYCEDPVRFARLVLGLNLYPAQQEWTRNFQARRFFHAAPRDHGKSTMYCFLLPLWEAVRRPEQRIMMLSKTSDLASRFITAIRQELEGNRILQTIYGNLKPDRPRAWNRYALYLRRSTNVREPTIFARAVCGSCAGLRADLIIADDIVDSETSFYQASRDRVTNWFLSELTPVLEAGGRLLVVGTRKHHDDLYSRLMRNPAYQSRIDRAILDEQKGEVLMPERWPFERLLEDRAELGSVLFNREKQNVVYDNNTSLFRREWLAATLEEGYRLNDFDTANGPRVMGIDLAAVTEPARAEESDSDYSAAVSLQRRDSRWVVVGMWMKRGLTPASLLEQIAAEAERIKPELIVVENNAFQGWVEHELKQRLTYPVVGQTTGGHNRNSLETGVPSLATLFERKEIILPAGDDHSRGWSERLCGQLHGLGWERHDDLVMALWLAICAGRKMLDRPSYPHPHGPSLYRFR